MKKVRAGVVGFRGYSGSELTRILEYHPEVAEVVHLEHRSDSLDRPQPIHARVPRRIACSAQAAKDEQLGCVFLATPPEVSMDLAPAMLEVGLKVIDLSGAFRLGHAEAYQRWYKASHSAPVLLQQAVYGLPEMNRSKLLNAAFVSNPGCYPTAANLAIQPLIAAGVVELELG